MDEPIPNSLKEYRTACALSQVAVAMRLGLESHDRVSHWERGSMYPHMLNLFKLSVIYRQNPLELYPVVYERVKSEVERGTFSDCYLG